MEFINKEDFVVKQLWYMVVIGKQFADKYELAQVVGVLRDSQAAEKLGLLGISIHGINERLVLRLGGDHAWHNEKIAKQKIASMVPLLDSLVIGDILLSHRLVTIMEFNFDSIEDSRIRKFYHTWANDGDEESTWRRLMEGGNFGKGEFLFTRHESRNIIRHELSLVFPSQVLPHECVKHCIAFVGNFVMHGLCPKIRLTPEEQRAVELYLGKLGRFPAHSDAE